MSVELPSSRFSWAKASLFATALIAGAGIGIGFAISLGSSGSPVETPTIPSSAPGISWPARARPAPGFTLHDERGQPISLDSLRGRTVILAFIDPVCRNLCPLEAKVLNSVPAKLPALTRPAIVAVSVNPWGQARSNLRLDAARWKLVPQWHWALGRFAALAKVWKRYAIGVRVRTRTLAGITVHTVDHTEAAYVIDAEGYERALFVFPYGSADVVNAVRRVIVGHSSASQR